MSAKYSISNHGRNIGAKGTASQDLAEIKARVSSIPLRPGGSGFAIQEYDNFPPIPGSPTIIQCYNQLWYADIAYTVWRPLVIYAAQTGEPGT